MPLAESQHTHFVSSHTDSRKHALFRTSAVIAKPYGPCRNPAMAAWQPCVAVLLGSDSKLAAACKSRELSCCQIDAPL